MTTGGDTPVEAELRRALDVAVLRLEELLGDAHGFVETVAHDLRAPLAAMSGFAELVAKDENLPVISQQLLRRIVVSAHTTAERVESVLLQARARAGELREDVDLADSLDWVRALVDLEVVTVRAAGPLPVVRANPMVVRQVLLNLVDNATAHAPHDGGPVDVAVTARRVRVDDVSLWEVRVVDDGPGIAEELCDDVVAERPDDPCDVPGLVRSRRLVESQGGTLVVERAEGAGCLVRFTLPTRA
jgi:histidine kinase